MRKSFDPVVGRKCFLMLLMYGDILIAMEETQLDSCRLPSHPVLCSV